MTEARAAAKIAVRRRGTRLGFWFFRAAGRLFGLRGAYGLLYLVCLHYLLFDRAAVRSAKAYLRRRFPTHGFWRLTDAVYRLFINQGRNLIDRHYLVERLGPMEMDIVGFEPLRELVAAGRGMILLTAHLGNWQVVMSALRTLGRPVHLLMRPEDNPAVQANLRVSQANDAIRLISPEGFLGGVVEVMAVLRQGGIVSIMGDRTYGFEAVDVEFLGAPARFPRGAFTIAAAVECPVVVLLSAKVGALRYRMEVAGIIEPRYREEGDKRTQVRGWVQAFARLLEDHIRRYPYQCFLFHDVWAEAAECAEAGPATAGRRRR